MSTLYEKTENLWQTLNAVRMLAATGKPLDPETIGQVKTALDANNPSDHMAEMIITVQGLQPGHHYVKIDTWDSQYNGLPIDEDFMVPEKITSNSPTQLLIKIPTL